MKIQKKGIGDTPDGESGERNISGNFQFHPNIRQNGAQIAEKGKHWTTGGNPEGGSSGRYTEQPNINSFFKWYRSMGQNCFDNNSTINHDIFYVNKI